MIGDFFFAERQEVSTPRKYPRIRRSKLGRTGRGPAGGTPTSTHWLSSWPRDCRALPLRRLIQRRQNGSRASVRNCVPSFMQSDVRREALRTGSSEKDGLKATFLEITHRREVDRSRCRTVARRAESNDDPPQRRRPPGRFGQRRAFAESGAARVGGRFVLLRRIEGEDWTRKPTTSSSLCCWPPSAIVRWACRRVNCRLARWSLSRAQERPASRSSPWDRG